jgi:predicted amidohydrolase
MANPVHVLCVQTVIREAAGATAERAIADNLHRAIALVDKAAQRTGPPDIVVLPEFFLTGMASTRPHEECLAIARTIPGPETEALGALARRLGCYVAGAAWERDDAWPGRFFNGAFVIGPGGEVELRYRKVNEGNFHAGVTGTTPADVHDGYVDDLFPVLRTPHGVLGCVICYDVNFPETVRQLVFRGAEIILHPTGEPNGGYLDLWQSARRVRAIESQVCWVSANHGGFVPVQTGDGARGAPVPEVLTAPLPGGLTPTSPSMGRSQVVSWTGEVLGALSSGEGVLDAWLDVDGLRAARADAARLGWPTPSALAPAQLESLAGLYDDAPGFPPNRLLHEPLRTAADGLRHLAEVRDGLRGSPILATAPSEPAGVLAYQADVRVVGRGASPAELAAAVREVVDATRPTLEAELARTSARILVLPFGWPAFAAADDGRAPVLPLDDMDPVRELVRDLGVHAAIAGRFAAGAGGRVVQGALLGPDGELALVRTIGVPLPHGYEDPAPADACRTTAPVADTRYGRIGLVVGREVLVVEAVRGQALAGAELLLHPSVELDAWAVPTLREVVRVRAAENALWIASAHPASLLGPVPAGASLGGTVVHDHTGGRLGELPPGRVAGVAARFDAASLRAARSVAATNTLLQLRTHLYAGG